MIYRANLEEMRTKIKKRIEVVRMAIKRCPKGYVLKTGRGQRYEYIHIFYEKRERKRKRIKPGSPLFNQLLYKRGLEYELRVLEQNYQVICEAIDKFSVFSADVVRSEIMGNLAEEYAQMLSGRHDRKGAGIGENQSAYMPEGRVHTTSRGLKVRSKSELLIAEKFYDYNLEFCYEEMLEIGKHTLVPDFTVTRDDGKIFYWEHCGRTHDKQYMEHHRWKMNLYEGIGIVPWDNLIVTYDDETGSINLEAAEAEIRIKLLV